MGKSVFITRHDLTEVFERLVVSQRQACLTFCRGESLDDVPFRIVSFDRERGLATAISAEQRLVLQFAVEDIDRIELASDSDGPARSTLQVMN